MSVRIKLTELSHEFGGGTFCMKRGRRHHIVLSIYANQTQRARYNE